MKSVNKIQIAVIAGSILLVVLLLFANTKLPLKEEAAETDQHDHANEGVNILDFVGTVKANLPEGEKQEVKKAKKAENARKEF